MTHGLTPTGTLDDGTLVLTRTYPASPDVVWASVVEPDRLERWFGTWTGNPADGFVMVKMNAEPAEAPATRYEITACEPPNLLRVEATDGYGTWLIDLELTSAPDGTTTFVLRQREIDLGMVHDIGPGWEWYLDRQAAALAGIEPPTLAAFETTYRALGRYYASLTES